MNIFNSVLMVIISFFLVFIFSAIYKLWDRQRTKINEVMGGHSYLPDDKDGDGFRDFDLDNDGIVDSKDEDFKRYYRR